MMKKLSALFTAVFILMLASPLVMGQVGTPIEATYDSWIREVDNSDINLRDNDLISVASSTSTFNVRYGIVEFDLSSLTDPITEAHLQLWNQANGFSDDTAPIKQTAVLIDGAWTSPAGGGALGVGTLNWEGINNAITAGMQLPELGRIDIGPVGDVRDWVNTAASEVEITALNADRTGDQLATFVFIGFEDGNPPGPDNDYRNSWGDGTLNGMRSLLTINGEPVGFEPPPPVPGELESAIWLREASAHPNDGVLVSNNSEIIGGAPTVGLMQWDLGLFADFVEHPERLTGATLELFGTNAARTQEPGQTAGLIDTSLGTQLMDLQSEPAYQAEYGGTELSLEGLGVVPDTTGPINDGESILTIASEADLQLIRDVLNSRTKRLTMVFQGSDAAAPDGVTGQYWGDGIFGIAPILTLVPEPSSLLLIGMTLASLLVGGVRRR